MDSPQNATVVSRVDADLTQRAHFLGQSLEQEIVRRLATSSGRMLGVWSPDRVIAALRECTATI